MSNDLKVWIARIALFLLLSADASLVFQVGMSAGHVSAMTYVKLVLSMLASFVVAFWYYIVKSKRWDHKQGKTQEQIEFETLAAYAAQQQKERQQAQQTQKQDASATPQPMQTPKPPKEK